MRSVISAVAASAIVVFAASAASAKVLTFCAAAAPEGFDPAPYASPATFDASSQALYNRLVEFEPGNSRLRASLAESWEVSEDGLTYTFHIRPGVKFQTTPYFTPERELNADDVVFSLGRQRDPKSSYYDYAGGFWPYYTALSLDTLVTAVKKVDDMTVSITLEKPEPSLLPMLAMDFASILSRDYAIALAEADARQQLSTRPIGTGPYQFVDSSSGRVVYKANPDYWRGAQKIDLLAFVAEPDSAVRLKKLQSGECQVMAHPDSATLKAAAADSNLDIAETDRFDVAYFALNALEPPFGDVRVRQAIGMAIDKQAIADAIYGAGASAATSVVPPSMADYDPAAGDPPYDPDTAKQLLQAAAVPNLAFTLLTSTASRPYNPDPARMAQMIAADLAKVGVTVTVKPVDILGEFLAQSSARDRSGAVLLGWTSDDGDLGDYLSVLLSCEAVGQSNRAQWCNAPVDELVAAARATPDEEARAELFAEAQKRIATNQPLTAIAHTVTSVPLAKSVTGFVASPFALHNFEGVDIAE